MQRTNRIALAATALVVALLAFAPAAFAAVIKVPDPSGPAKTELIAHAYRFNAGIKIPCPATSTKACTIRTTVTALTHPAIGAPKLVVVAAGSGTAAPGASAQVYAKVNAAGVAELKARGTLRGHVEIMATEDGTNGPDRYAGQQDITIPPVTLDANTRAKKVKLAPGQRLVLVLDGESASTGYAWKFDKLAGSALRMVSNKVRQDPSCTPGTAGCFQIRTVVYAGKQAGTTTVSTGLYGPEAETDATVRITLAVSTLAVPPAAKVITIADKKAVSLLKGQDLVLQLEENPSTGYAWTIDKLMANAALKLAAQKVYVETCPAGAAGCAATREITYTSMRAGTTMLKASLFAPGADAANKNYSFTVTTAG